MVCDGKLNKWRSDGWGRPRPWVGASRVGFFRRGAWDWCCLGTDLGTQTRGGRLRGLWAAHLLWAHRAPARARGEEGCPPGRRPPPGDNSRPAGGLEAVDELRGWRAISPTACSPLVNPAVSISQTEVGKILSPRRSANNRSQRALFSLKTAYTCCLSKSVYTC